VVRLPCRSNSPRHEKLLVLDSSYIFALEMNPLIPVNLRSSPIEKNHLGSRDSTTGYLPRRGSQYAQQHGPQQPR
jgi:hypothetical protein